jgi:hypothetical protein
MNHADDKLHSDREQLRGKVALVGGWHGEDSASGAATYAAEPAERTQFASSDPSPSAHGSVARNRSDQSRSPLPLRSSNSAAATRERADQSAESSAETAESEFNALESAALMAPAWDDAERSCPAPPSATFAECTVRAPDDDRANAAATPIMAYSQQEFRVRLCVCALDSVAEITVLEFASTYIYRHTTF